MNDDGLILMILFALLVMFGIPLILTITGIAIRNKNKKTSKTLFIIAAVYAIISLGICGSMMM